MDGAVEFWNRACEFICEKHGLNRAELDRGLQSGRWHLAFDFAIERNADGIRMGECAVSLKDGPSAGLQ